MAWVGVAVKGREVEEPSGLTGECGEHPGMGVTEGVDAQAGHHIEVAIAVEIEEEGAFAPFHDDGVAGVDGEHAAGVAPEDCVGGRAGDHMGVKLVHVFQFTGRGGIGQGKAEGEHAG